MMIASSRVARRKYRLYKWTELEIPDEPQPRRKRVARWITNWRSKSASLCDICRSRNLDLRPLTAEPPDFCELPDNPENEDLDELEKRYTVSINDFSPEEAREVRLTCSLCALLLCCLDATEQDGWLGYMRCICTLRPRFDRSTNGKGGRIIHKQQVWVEFQPIEGEVLLDMVDIEGFRSSGEKRKPIPAIANLKLLRYWLKDCDKKHRHPDIPNAILSRIQAVLDGGIFRVINTSTGVVEVLASLSKFVALSYVWGLDSSQPKNQPLKGGPISDYPPTIRDSINVAKSLGYEWLWVDRVCIDQTSDSEKAKLIPYMKDIYAAAHLTIVAACGESAQNGLLGTQETPRNAKSPLIIGPSVAFQPICPRFENIISKTTWNKRGWTFQEYVFARRLLFVFDSEMFFKCAEYTFRESRGHHPVIDNQGSVNRWMFNESGICNAARLQAILHGKEARTEDLLTAQTFLDAVMEYSARKLTIGEDRVDAFAGVILAAMSPMDQASEQAFLKHGHPLPFFESLLTWRCGLSLIGTPDPNLKLPVPSWSWAHTGVEVYIPIMGETGGCYDQYRWFQYSQVWNYDVLGLPTKYNAMDHLVQLSLPDELVADQSWIPSLPQDSNSAHGGESTIIPTPTSLSPPKLHLLTIVFDARLARCDPLHPTKHILLAPESTETTAEVVKQYWDLRLDIMETWSFQPGYESLFPSEGASPRQQPFETFAVVAGYPYVGAYRGNQWSNEVHFELHVMLLEPTVQQDTYSRLGINRLRNVWKESFFADTIRRGRPRWQYIHII
ncbi:hypothetical protein ANO14919_118890 [Xylariales sp. No.14919]|nr:heterokaryon incompatibility protein-domain-containing protein [Xylaria grammica]GAW22352.1 hypothetical protein ANO14919_118890 [Xylariales sp. No.14919]